MPALMRPYGNSLIFSLFSGPLPRSRPCLLATVRYPLLDSLNLGSFRARDGIFFPHEHSITGPVTRTSSMAPERCRWMVVSKLAFDLIPRLISRFVGLAILSFFELELASFFDCPPYCFVPTSIFLQISGGSCHKQDLPAEPLSTKLRSEHFLRQVPTVLVSGY